MFGNLKEFFSVVQDGITSNTNLRQTLQEVQKVKYIFREKSKYIHETKVNYYAGTKILDKYQQQWAEMHQIADENAKAAEDVDKSIVAINEEAKLRLIHANDLAQSLVNLPKLSAAVDECLDSLNEVAALIEVVEKELFEFEDIVDRSNVALRKREQHYNLALYKKLAALENIRGQLSNDNSSHYIQCDKERLEALHSSSAAAFNKDIANYRASGQLPASPASSTPKLSLEQIQLEVDNEDLDKFLNS